MSDEILVDISDGVAVITFNRPDTMNTFTGGMIDGLGAAYERCDQDDDARVIVITGNVSDGAEIGKFPGVVESIRIAVRQGDNRCAKRIPGESKRKHTERQDWMGFH